MVVKIKVPFWVPYRCRLIVRTQKGTIILTTTHVWCSTEPAVSVLMMRNSSTLPALRPPLVPEALEYRGRNMGVSENRGP